MSSKCKRKEVAIMQEVIRDYLEQAKVGRKEEDARGGSRGHKQGKDK
jgi:hypothetical protein